MGMSSQKDSKEALWWVCLICAWQAPGVLKERRVCMKICLGKEKAHTHNYRASENLEDVCKRLFCIFQSKVSLIQAILELEAILLPQLLHHAISCSFGLGQQGHGEDFSKLRF